MLHVPLNEVMAEEQSLQVGELIQLILRGGGSTPQGQWPSLSLSLSHHDCDSVAAEVELSQSVQAGETCHHGDLIASQVEHTQVAQMPQTLNLSDLRKKQTHFKRSYRTHTHTHHVAMEIEDVQFEQRLQA